MKENRDRSFTERLVQRIQSILADVTTPVLAFEDLGNFTLPNVCQNLHILSQLIVEVQIDIIIGTSA